MGRYLGMPQRGVLEEWPLSGSDDTRTRARSRRCQANAKRRESLVVRSAAMHSQPLNSQPQLQVALSHFHDQHCNTYGEKVVFCRKLRMLLNNGSIANNQVSKANKPTLELLVEVA